MKHWEPVFHAPNDYISPGSGPISCAFKCADNAYSMEALRELFPMGSSSVDEMNMVLFSTSGIHGSYMIIEEYEKELWERKRLGDKFDYEEHGEELEGITFLMIQPRLVIMRYGLVFPEDKEDFEFLKRLRKASWEAFSKIGENWRRGRLAIH